MRRSACSQARARTSMRVWARATSRSVSSARTIRSTPCAKSSPGRSIVQSNSASASGLSMLTASSSTQTGISLLFSDCAYDSSPRQGVDASEWVLTTKRIASERSIPSSAETFQRSAGWMSRASTHTSRFRSPRAAISRCTTWSSSWAYEMKTSAIVAPALDRPGHHTAGWIIVHTHSPDASHPLPTPDRKYRVHGVKAQADTVGAPSAVRPGTGEI